MTSTFTTNLAIEKQGTGDNSGTWGVELNENFDIIDDAVAGRINVAVTGAGTTLTAAQYQNRVIRFTGTLGSNEAVVFPNIEMVWEVINATSGSFTLTCKVSGQTGVVIGQGERTRIGGNGTDVESYRGLTQDQQEIYGLTAGSSTAYTLTLVPAITAYKTGQVFHVKWHTANTSSTPTLAVNGLSALTIVNSDNSAVVSGQLGNGGFDILIYDGTSLRMCTPNGRPFLARANTFSATQTMSGAAINQAKGSDIASATTTDIGAATGNSVDVTGSVTITGLGTVQAGTLRHVRFTGAPLLTHNGTSLILPGAANIQAAAGDCATFMSLGSGNWLCCGYFPATGRSVIGAAASDTVAGDIEIAAQSEMEAGSDTTRAVTPGRQHYHPLHPKAWVNIDGTGVIAIREDWGVSSLGDNGTGDYTVNLDTAFAATTYGVGATVEGYGSAAASMVGPRFGGTRTTTAIEIYSEGNAASTKDTENGFVEFFGDQ